jgi:peptidyl-tRNA hydrolase
MKERSEPLLVTQIFAICFKHAKTIDEITKKIYNNGLAKNVVRVYQCCEILMEHNILVPKFQNNQLRFQVNQDILVK